MLPDHERLLVDGKQVVYEPTIQMLRLAYALNLDLGCPVKVMTLPEKYLEKTHTGKGEPKVKADLDGCVAKGMTQSEWRQIKEEVKNLWELDIGVEFIVSAMAAADPDEFLKSTVLKARFEKLSVHETMTACRTLAEALKSRSYNAAEKRYDENKFEAYCKRAVEWVKANGVVGVTLRTFKRAVRLSNTSAAEGGTVIAHCIAEEHGRVVLVKRGLACEVVASFTLLGCTYGEIRYPGGQSQRRYRVKVQSQIVGKSEIREISMDGDLYNAERYTKACADLNVADPKHFKMYVGEKLAEAGFQKHDPDLDMPLFVGLFAENGSVKASTKVAFPRGVEDCYYNNADFPSRGDADKSFQEVARISRLADVLFVLALGAPLKAILGFYPHGLVVGRRFMGKTSASKSICDRTGFAYVSGKRQFGSNYRQLRIMGNHNLPAIIDECHRIDSYALPGMLETLNTAYNGAATTHGTDGYYFLSGCAVMLGQDVPAVDEALDSKQIVLHFAAKDLNHAGGKDAKHCVSSFPFVGWMKSLASNATVIAAELEKKEEWLRMRLQQEGAICEEGDRTILNYAAVLVSAEFLRRFGVDAQIDEKIVELCKLHVAGKLHTDAIAEAHSSAEKFVRDVLESLSLVQERQGMAGAFDIKDEGVWFKVEPWFSPRGSTQRRPTTTPPTSIAKAR